jgi:hypothetical protein
MTNVEWLAFVGVPVILICLGFIAERLHARWRRRLRSAGR